MDPRLLGPEQWNQLSVLLLYLFLFVGLIINTALSFLLAHGIIPSLVNTTLATADLFAFRRVLYPVVVVSGVLTAIALWRAISLIIVFVNYLFPRGAI